MKTHSCAYHRQIHSLARNARLFMAVVCILIAFSINNSSPVFAASIKQESPIAVVTASYQAMDTAMNAGNVIHSPQAAMVQPLNALLTPMQARVDANASGAALYQYNLTRVGTFRSWTAIHTHDFSAVNVWSTFKTASVSIQGSVSRVVGDETWHIDTTVQANNQPTHMSPHKKAVMARLKNTSSSIGVGQTDHGTAQIHHMVTLHQVKQTWVIESDQYSDPLEQIYQSDHHTLLQSMLPSGRPPRQPRPHTTMIQQATYNYVYNRSAAINYADAWWNSCHSPAYQCYISQGVDCANFVSQSIYDISGGNIPGDYNYWYSIPNVGTTTDFVNAPGLYNYMVNNPDGLAYVLESDYQPETTNWSTALTYDETYEAPGDVIYYDWLPTSGTKNHVTISVAADAVSGYTYVDSHTPNEYHFPWDLNWTNAGVGFFFVELGDYGLSVAPQ